MFVLNPDPYLLPCYRISPFQTKDMHINNTLPESNLIDDYFNDRFKGRPYRYMADGRSAISLALSYYHLQPDDVVTILTSSANFYISSCVTATIEKFCKWSRQVEPNTRLLLVNHEFGYPYTNLEELKRYNLPLIEDCAHSFFSAGRDNAVGNTGDFAIYSFPKMFPIQTGGLLTSKKGIDLPGTEFPGKERLQYIKNVLSHYITQRDTLISRRLNNYQYLLSNLPGDHFEERFELTEAVVPGVCMFRVKNERIDLPKLKEYLYAHGIQCSVFYGEHAFFIPVHQALNEADLDYFLTVIRAFAGKYTG